MPGFIFVFGSNLAGRHGAGAALFAQKFYKAQPGVGEGLTGSSYALPTKDKAIMTRPLPEVKASIATFVAFAEQHPELLFKVTRVGCGLAGFTDEQIAPCFLGAPPNCAFDPEWARFGLQGWDALDIA